MTKNKDFSFVSGPLVDKCLIAMPGMRDQRFEKAVVYICSDDEKEGTMGLVINKVAHHVAFSEILLQLKLPLGEQKNYPPVLMGGPMDSIRGFILHSSDYGNEQTVSIAKDISLTATTDILKDIAEGKGPKKHLIALGHSSWTAGQLEAEIAGNSWLVLPSDDTLLFDCPLKDRWKTALLRMGVDPVMLSLEQGSV